MGIKLYAAPLQGFTDFKFRNAFNKHFNNLTAYYAPYIRLKKNKDIKPSYLRDIDPKNNSELRLVPQVMTNNADEFLFVAEQVQQLAYEELNWNIGCPYPMVTKRGLGSGLLQKPHIIKNILQEVLEKSNIQISLKLRLGLENKNEILDLLHLIEGLPIKNITIHPRIGKQLYKGDVDLEMFDLCAQESTHSIIYNGDITTVNQFNELSCRFPNIEQWMIGRGLIADPFLPEMIQTRQSKYPKDRTERFSKFHDDLFQAYSDVLSGKSHILIKMLHFWQYFALTTKHPHKNFKKIKKAKNIQTYEMAVKEIISEW